MLLCAMTDKQEKMEKEGTTGRDEGCSGTDGVQQDGVGKDVVQAQGLGMIDDR